MPAVVSATTFTPTPGKAEELLALLGELLRSIHAEPGSSHYSVHQTRADPSGPLLVIQAYVSYEAFQSHSAAMAAADAPGRIARLVTQPPTPPVLFEPLALGGVKAKARLGQESG